MNDDDRIERQQAIVKGWMDRFPDLAEPWVHMTEDGTRMWLTSGKDGPMLAISPLLPPPAKEEAP